MMDNLEVINVVFFMDVNKLPIYYDKNNLSLTGSQYYSYTLHISKNIKTTQY